MIPVRVRTVIALTIVAACAIAAPFAVAVDAAGDITAMIANAKTAADHEAIAAYYDKEAATSKEKAALHRRMLEVIKKRGGGPDIAKWRMDQHCEDLVKGFDSAAKMYTEMAQAHREMAKDAK